MAVAPLPSVLWRWDLAAESIAVKIRWFGLVVAFGLVNFSGSSGDQQLILNAILSLGVLYALLDTVYSWRGEIFLGQWPLLISLMEALFIGVLCYYHGGIDSAFRNYYYLSLICCAMRYPRRVTYTTCALHCTSFFLLYLALPSEQVSLLPVFLTGVILFWVTWASDSLAQVIKRAGEHLGQLNAALQENQALLEARIAERTRQLREAQAHVLHQEKMAAFGLLAAGIAHEVGNPLASISGIVQLLQRRDADAYTEAKLALVNDQLQRIQAILRELVNFSRPASKERTRVDLKEILEEALNIAKYYSGQAGRAPHLASTPAETGRGRTKARRIEMQLPTDLPPLWAARDQLVQVFLNLILNAVDATSQGGRIELKAEVVDEQVVVEVSDDGHGIAESDAARLFQPYFTTKKHGTGLGLFVTRKMIIEQGGTIEFCPNSGQGSCFRVRLPLKESVGIPKNASPQLVGES